MREPAPRSQLVTCLWSSGQAEEAARFYVGAFAGYRPDTHLDEVQYSAVDVAPEGETVHVPAGQVLTVSFTLDGQRFMVLNDPAVAVPYTDAVSVQVLCDNQEEVDHFWSALTAGGGRPLACGWLQDRFGMRWQVVPTVLPELLGGDDRDAAARVQRALLGMQRISIEGLMDAAQDAYGAEEQ